MKKSFVLFLNILSVCFLWNYVILAEDLTEVKSFVYSPETTKIEAFFIEVERPNGSSFVVHSDKDYYFFPYDFQLNKEKMQNFDVKKIHNISIIDYRIDTELMDMLYLFSDVKVLNFSACTFADNVECDWSRFKYLEYLSLYRCKNVPSDVIKSLPECLKLDTLFISVSFNNYKSLISDCNKLPALRRLILELSPLEEFPSNFEILRYISKNTRQKIRFLTLIAPLTDKTAHYLHKFPNLEFLCIDGYNRPNIGKTVTDGFVARISDIPLVALQIPMSAITEKSISVLKEWKSLKHLRLSLTRITPSQMAELKTSRDWEFFECDPRPRKNTIHEK